MPPGEEALRDRDPVGGEGRRGQQPGHACRPERPHVDSQGCDGRDSAHRGEEKSGVCLTLGGQLPIGQSVIGAATGVVGALARRVVVGFSHCKMHALVSIWALLAQQSPLPCASINCNLAASVRVCSTQHPCKQIQDPEAVHLTPFTLLASTSPARVLPEE